VRNVNEKIMTLPQAAAWRKQLIVSNKSLVVTNGCFDLIHRGHIEYLNGARQAGDALLVGINSDSSIRQLKGPTRPLVEENDRAYVLASLESIDVVVIFTEVIAVNLLASIRPDVYVKGGDYTKETLNPSEYDTLTEIGCKIEFIKFLDGHSTTGLIEKIRSKG
jgi:D-glycero-beta-D-manno-heptose 1-phosphate adenylyltransferase